jgi:hypothetical protein
MRDKVLFVPVKGTPSLAVTFTAHIRLRCWVKLVNHLALVEGHILVAANETSREDFTE